MYTVSIKENFINALTPEQLILTTGILERFQIFIFLPLALYHYNIMSYSDLLRWRHLQLTTTPCPLDMTWMLKQTCSWIKRQSRQQVISYEERSYQRHLRIFSWCRSLSVLGCLQCLHNEGESAQGGGRWRYKMVVLLEQHKLIYHSPGVRRRSLGCEF